MDWSPSMWAMALFILVFTGIQPLLQQHFLQSHNVHTVLFLSSAFLLLLLLLYTGSHVTPASLAAQWHRWTRHEALVFVLLGLCSFLVTVFYTHSLMLHRGTDLTLFVALTSCSLVVTGVGAAWYHGHPLSLHRVVGLGCVGLGLYLCK